VGLDAMTAESAVQGRRTRRFIGGMRWRGSNATWPFAELLLEDEGVCIRLRSPVLRRVIGRWFPSVAVPLGGLREVRRIRGGIPLPGNGGLEFVQVVEPSERLVFWCTKRVREEAAGLLSARGVVVVDGGKVW
jgi:hypothetical protein